MGYSVDGKTINGLVNKNGEVLINIDSDNALNRIVGHETTHLLEDTQEYKELQKIVKQYATTKGEYDTRLKELQRVYKGTNANIENELTSDLVGDYLFSDADFINNLSTEKPNLFKRIHEEIKHLYKLATAGSKEARELEKVKKAFDKAYKNTTTNSDGEVLYSLKGVDENGIEVYETSKEVKALSYKERKSILLDSIKNEYIGRTAKFVKNGKTYYAKLNLTSIRKGIYGDKKSDKKGYNAKINIGADKNYFELAENSLYINSGDEKGKRTNSNIHKDTKQWDYYTKTIKCDNSYFDVLINVADKGNDQYVYDITLNENKKIASQAVATEATLNQGKAINTNISQKKNGVNNSISNNSENSVKFSLKDSEGNQLTKEQAEFFKDSKVRDENGDLLVVYHGTNAEFTAFDRDFLGTSSTKGAATEYGFFFIDDYDYADYWGENAVRDYNGEKRGNT